MIILNNSGPVKDNEDGWNPWFPRLQVNRHGEIILATGKNGYLTRGVLVGKTPESKSNIPIGKVFTDWEVAGLLKDYNGEVTVTFKNKDEI